MNSCHPPSKTLINLCQMHQTRSHRRKAKYLKRHKGSMSSIKGVCHLSRRAKRRLYCKLQLWMWRKRREKCRFAIFRTKKRAVGMSSSSCLSVEGQPQKNKSSVVSPLGCDTGYDTLRRKNCSLKLCHCGSVSENVASSSSQNQAMDVVNAATTAAEMPSPKTETLERLNELKEPLKRSHGVKPLLTLDSDVCGLTTHFEEPRTLEVSQSFGIYGSLGQLTPASRGQDQTPNINADERMTRKPTMCFKPDASIAALTKVIHEFLDDFYRIYGSFIPLQKSDLLTHLKRRFNTDFGDRKNTIFLQVTKCQTTITQKPAPSFRVVYKKHTLILDDLSTLADQNWLNDQVMNMYGELIMESANHKVHFLNSFFHRQLMTKGYDGVKRWTKQVDLFSKSLLLVPIHLEVHWCLVTADSVRKKIYLYDSQGNGLQKVARNILKYLMTEAKERKQTAFENGWVVSFEENIPQQTNENDCGVFVLEYSRCLALGKPLQFSQKDIPNIRKRIYKELCDCKLHAQS